MVSKRVSLAFTTGGTVQGDDSPSISCSEAGGAPAREVRHDLRKKVPFAKAENRGDTIVISGYEWN